MKNTILFSGKTHQSCNLNRANRKYDVIPIFFHNGSGYDFQMLLSNFSDKDTKISGLPDNG